MTISYGEEPDVWGRVAEVYAERDAETMQRLDRILGIRVLLQRDRLGRSPATFCPKGHNDWRVKPGNGKRYCYTCHKESERVRRRMIRLRNRRAIS